MHFFSYIKRKTKSRPSIGPLKNSKKETVSDDQGMSELLNELFGSVFTREETNIIPEAEEMETGSMEDVVITPKWSKKKSKT